MEDIWHRWNYQHFDSDNGHRFVFRHCVIFGFLMRTFWYRWISCPISTITFGIHQRMYLMYLFDVSIDRYIKYDRYSDMWIYPGSDNCKVVQVQQVQPIQQVMPADFHLSQDRSVVLMLLTPYLIFDPYNKIGKSIQIFWPVHFNSEIYRKLQIKYFRSMPFWKHYLLTVYLSSAEKTL